MPCVHIGAVAGLDIDCTGNRIAVASDWNERRGAGRVNGSKSGIGHIRIRFKGSEGIGRNIRALLKNLERTHLARHVDEVIAVRLKQIVDHIQIKDPNRAIKAIPPCVQALSGKNGICHLRAVTCDTGRVCNVYIKAGR